ncbi:MAG TPA: carboxypeptidase-like regulatory domain-containing protein [Mucilaginibacter sp.]|nr:carboxypeptidase-like regulatory domain-containing protein [Mucilaginibacter sp.]
MAAKAQDINTDKITLGLNDESLEGAIKKIEGQSAFRFFYREAEVKAVMHLSLNPETRTIAQTLAVLLQNTSLCFKQVDNHILLEHKELLTACDIKGMVVTSIDNLPLPNASVFLSNATIGTITADDGTFSLPGVKPGKYELIISLVGFETHLQTVDADSRSISIPAVMLTPQTIVLNEVKVSSKQDPDREKNYNLFKDEFLGNSKLAHDCRILNPELLDLDFDYSANILTASSEDFLEIENDALGYKIKYLLTNFVKDVISNGTNDIQFGGPAFFREMKGSPAQEKRWQKQRREVYEGSIMHFLRSVLNNSYEEEGFRVLRIAILPNPERPPDSLITAEINRYKGIKHKNRSIRDTLAYWQGKLVLPKTIKKLLPDPLKQADLAKLTSQKGLFALPGSNCSLYVVFSKNHHFPSKVRIDNLNEPGNDNRTIVNFDAPYVLFDKNGCVMDPTCLSFEGAWGKSRVADLLPVDYDPDAEFGSVVVHPPAVTENALLPNASQPSVANTAKSQDTLKAAKEARTAVN